MARTKSEEFDHIKEHILQCATTLFASKGFANSNIIEIGKACNASKSRMYHYFPSKESILETMLRAHVEDLLAVVSDIAEQDDDPALVFERYIRAHLEYYYQNSERHSVLIQDADHLSPKARKDLKAAETRLVTFLIAILQRLNKERYRERNIAVAHAMLIYGMLNWTYTWYKPSGHLSFETLAREATDLCLNGIS
ncbi:MAG: TetR/AcrR family transcriptional regulator [Candidimonas sp.]|jgi:AcrR family transcriptional regulator